MTMGPGTLVRLKSNIRMMARVQGNIRGVRGGRVLDRLLCGFTMWNMEELEPVPKHSPLRRYFKEEG
jgi:hypothetical protein